ncbi:MAG: response regulator transcription factor [Chromatiaceae bacterium]|jgi:two-component system response regulator RegX3|nr:response regulator transcription factor [Chromatiaceae bacterium]
MPSKPRLLIVEDEAAIRAGLEDVFVYHGYAVDSAAEGREGLRKALSGRFDLILLDVMLPGLDGFTICERIRAVDREQPIILLTAKTSDEDIVQGLRLGADDYVGKPFSVTQLVARVEAVLRRARLASDPQRIHLGEAIEIDVANLSARRGAETIAFTRREMDVLQYLGANPERAVSREELLTKVWGYARGLDLETRTVDIHIAKLRRKLEPDPAQPRYLITVRGAGYRLLSG